MAQGKYNAGYTKPTFYGDLAFVIATSKKKIDKCIPIDIYKAITLTPYIWQHTTIPRIRKEFAAFSQGTLNNV